MVDPQPGIEKGKRRGTGAAVKQAHACLSDKLQELSIIEKEVQRSRDRELVSKRHLSLFLPHCTSAVWQYCCCYSHLWQCQAHLIALLAFLLCDYCEMHGVNMRACSRWCL